MTKRQLLSILDEFDMDDEIDLNEINDNMYEQIPSTYIEIEYDNLENAEAIEGAKFDDLNFMRYFER